MTIRPPAWPGGIARHWRDPRNQKELDDGFIETVLALWNEGLNTWEMAQATHQPQADCERALHAGLEKRRREAETQDGGGYSPT